MRCHAASGHASGTACRDVFCITHLGTVICMGSVQAYMQARTVHAQVHVCMRPAKAGLHAGPHAGTMPSMPTPWDTHKVALATSLGRGIAPGDLGRAGAGTRAVLADVCDAGLPCSVPLLLTGWCLCGRLGCSCPLGLFGVLGTGPRRTLCFCDGR